MLTIEMNALKPVIILKQREFKDGLYCFKKVAVTHLTSQENCSLENWPPENWLPESYSIVNMSASENLPLFLATSS